MPVLTLNRSVTTEEPVLLVENRLAPGPHLFRLVVVDDAGEASDPAERVVTVLDRSVPVGPTRAPR